MHAGINSQSGVNLLQYNRSGKDTSSDDNSSLNQRLGDTQAIENMINGNYDDDKQYYSIGNKDSFAVADHVKHELDQHDLLSPDLMVDPFYRRHDDQQPYNDEEFETARLNAEGDADHNDKSDSNTDDEHKPTTNNKSVSSECNNDASFDNAEQMQQFLKSIKQGMHIGAKHVNSNKTASGQNKHHKQHAVDLDADKRDRHQHSESSHELSNDNETLEMIQEQTEHDTTKHKDSRQTSPDRHRSPSLPLLKARKLIDGDEQAGRNNKHTKDIEKRTETLMNKFLSSACSSQNSFKANLLESLDLNQSKCSAHCCRRPEGTRRTRT